MDDDIKFSESTVKATTSAARAVGAGATRTTATTATMATTAATAATAATMTPNCDEYNEDGNSKKNDKAMTKPTMRTEEGEPRQ